MEAGTVAVTVVVAFAAWWFLFGRGRADIWVRTWVVAPALIAYSVSALAVAGRLDEVLGPVGAVEIALGIGVGVAWLVATHVGHAVLCRLIPSFGDQVEGLYDLGADDPPARVVGPLVVMAVAEELLFRGVVQTIAGFAAGLALYTLVQFVERKWALALAALLGGAIWGALYEWTGGLVAPVLAHAVWTLSLTLVWPLRGCGREPMPTPADHA